MARITFSDPIANMSGKFHWQDKVVMRTVNGKTQAYTIKHPFKGERSLKQKQTANIFRDASNQTNAILHDPEQRAIWDAKFKDYCEYHKRHAVAPGTKRYTTLQGYIMASLHHQLRLQSQSD